MNIKDFDYQSVVILIPAKNEAATVRNVIEKIKQSLAAATIVVIDDASTDKTAEIARQAGAIVFSLNYSLGAWGATQTGLRYALEKGFKIAVTMDADGQHEANSISALLAPIIAQQCEVVIGSHPQRGSFARRSAWALFRALSGIHLKDLTSGLRAYHHDAIALLASKEATLLDYQDIGVLMLLHRAGLRLCEVSVFMYPRINGHSRIFNTWWTVGQYMLYTSILCFARGKRRKKCPIN